MSQPALFETDTKACHHPACGALRLPGQTGPIVTCHHDLERAAGVFGKRPRGCLNEHNPATADLPEGL